MHQQFCKAATYITLFLHSLLLVIAIISPAFLQCYFLVSTFPSPHISKVFLDLLKLLATTLQATKLVVLFYMHCLAFYSNVWVPKKSYVGWEIYYYIDTFLIPRWSHSTVVLCIEGLLWSITIKNHFHFHFEVDVDFPFKMKNVWKITSIQKLVVLWCNMYMISENKISTYCPCPSLSPFILLLILR